MAKLILDLDLGLQATVFEFKLVDSVLDHAVHTLEVVLVVSVHVDYCQVQRKARAEIFLANGQGRRGVTGEPF
jgi:hypothetical protein